MSTGSFHRTLLDPINLGIGIHQLNASDQQQILELEKKILEIKSLHSLKKAEHDQNDDPLLDETLARELKELEDTLRQENANTKEIIKTWDKKLTNIKLLKKYNTKFANTQYIDAFQAVSFDNIRRLLLLINQNKNNSDHIYVKLNDFKNLDSELTASFFKYRNNDFELSSKELTFLKNFKNLDFFLSHATTIDTQTISILYSRELLIKKNISFNQDNTQSIDIRTVHDTDFVFFYLYSVKSTSRNSRFGANEANLQINNSFLTQNNVYITLDDYAYPRGELSLGTNKKSNLIERATKVEAEDNSLPHLGAYMYNVVKTELHHAIKFHSFMGSDILKGLALAIIYLRRKYILSKSPRQEDLDFLNKVLLFDKTNPTHLENLNAMINGWIRPIVKVPKRVNF